MDMYAEVFRRTLKKVNDSGINLRDFEILKSELVDTILNYYLYLSIGDILEENDDFSFILFSAKYDIPLDSVTFLRDNFHKISAIAKSIELMKQIRYESDEEFQLMQQCLIIYLGKNLDMEKIMKMRGFGIRRNLKKKNMAIMIPNLYRILNEI